MKRILAITFILTLTLPFVPAQSATAGGSSVPPPFFQLYQAKSEPTALKVVAAFSLGAEVGQPTQLTVLAPMIGLRVEFTSARRLGSTDQMVFADGLQAGWVEAEMPIVVPWQQPVTAVLEISTPKGGTEVLTSQIEVDPAHKFVEHQATWVHIDNKEEFYSGSYLLRLRPEWELWMPVVKERLCTWYPGMGHPGTVTSSCRQTKFHRPWNPEGVRFLNYILAEPQDFLDAPRDQREAMFPNGGRFLYELITVDGQGYIISMPEIRR